jgi:GT2 family glycosyltransferase
MTSVAAVIPHWNRRDLLSEALASMADQTRPFDEILVVDNGSTDDSETVAAAAGAQFLKLGRNLGFAAAVNHGIRHSRADWIAILNNDVTLQPAWLREILRAAETQGVWFACGKVLAQSDQTRIDASFDEISRAACAWRCGSGKPDGPAWNAQRSIRIAPMTAALFRRELFDEIGLLDESFESYLEDVDFGLRCALKGRQGVYVPDAVAYHRGSATLGAWNSDTVRLLSRNQVLLAGKHYAGQPRFPILAGQLLWGLVALRHGQGWAYLNGKVVGCRVARSQTTDKTGHPRLREILEESEQTIFELQQQTGFDLYWRTYFCLSRR